MPDDVRIRPLRPDEAAAAEAVAWAALSPGIPEEFVATIDDQRTMRAVARIRHLAAHDPDGAWAAEDADGLCGLALSLVREGVWGLSLLAVRPERHAQGIGRRLLERALATAEGARGGIILSSSDPKAMRRYARAGFDVRPTVALTGAVNASRIPDGLRSRPGDLEADAATLDRASRHVRGATHRPDLPTGLLGDAQLLVCEDRGYAVRDGGRVLLLAAVDEAAATDLLWSCFAAAGPGTTSSIEFLTAGQDWAVRAALEAGLALTPDGPVFTRGDVGPFRPYLPSGAFL